MLRRPARTGDPFSGSADRRGGRGPSERRSRPCLFLHTNHQSGWAV